MNFFLISERLETASRKLINENKLEAGLAFPTGMLLLASDREVAGFTPVLGVYASVCTHRKGTLFANFPGSAITSKLL